MNKLICLSLTAAAFMAASCSSSDSNEDNPRYYIQLETGEVALMNTQNDFGYDLFGKMPVEDVTIVSPYSVIQCLSMIANGASGNTLAELNAALVANNMTLDDLNKLNKRLNKNLPVLDKKVEMSIANAVWFDNSLTVLPEFKQVCTDSYMAEIRTADLRSGSTVSDINKWVSDKTRGKINGFMKQVPADPQIVVNAIYFNGKWQNCFKEKNTKKDEFTNRSGSTTTVDMMARYNEEITYTETDDLQIGTLEYGNGAYQMIIALPKKNYGMLDDITRAQWNDIRVAGNVTKSRITLKMPKFEFERETDLTDCLTAMGLNDVFGTQCDFPAVSTGKTSFSAIKQNVYIKVDEKGTEATAATSNYGDTAPAPGHYDGREMIVDHPFAFMIIETSTNSVLFMGRINKM